MIKRIVDVSESAYLCLRDRQLLIKKSDVEVGSVPVEDLGVLILQHPAIVLTQSLVIACQKNNVVVIFCDERHLPYSILLPLYDGHSLHTKVLREQMALKTTRRKKLWQQIVVAKIQQQSLTLESLGRDTKSLDRLAVKVRSGDIENHEAQAARRYWRLLMGDDFRRDVNADGSNALLNYGYSIVRAAVARAIVSAGLHPAIGLHHSNQYNGLCLADDLMEPFRPWVDLLVFGLVEANGSAVVDRSTKSVLLGLISADVIMAGKRMSMMTSCHYLMAGLKRSIVESSISLEFPILDRGQLV
jgi:CRISPR-associated protein Cas1